MQDQSPVPNSQQQENEVNEQVQETEQEQQNQSSDWTSGIDLTEIGGEILNALGDFLSDIDLSL